MRASRYEIYLIFNETMRVRHTKIFLPIIQTFLRGLNLRYN